VANKFRHTGKRAGAPKGDSQIINPNGCPQWVGSRQNLQLLIHWIAIGLPRKQILRYMEETGMVMGDKLEGVRMQNLATFAKGHRDEIDIAREAMRVTARADAVQRREEFLEGLYTAKNLLWEEMMTDRDMGGRPTLVREHTQMCHLIADIEGFKKTSGDPRARQALDALLDRMLGAKDAATVVDAEVRVLQPAELPAGQ
jgi:hypothetical protein